MGATLAGGTLRIKSESESESEVKAGIGWDRSRGLLDEDENNGEEEGRCTWK